MYPTPSDGRRNGNGRPTTPEEAEERLNQRISFDYAFALPFLVILHGFSALKVLFILYINYNIATRLPRQYIPLMTWTFNIAILFANELCEGYKLKAIAGLLLAPSTGDSSAPDSILVSIGSFIDSFGGIMPRWEILFNITILRLISFNMDYYWSLGQRGASPVEVGSICLRGSVRPYGIMLICQRRSS